MIEKTAGTTLLLNCTTFNFNWEETEGINYKSKQKNKLKINTFQSPSKIRTILLHEKPKWRRNIEFKHLVYLLQIGVRSLHLDFLFSSFSSFLTRVS